MVERGTVKRSKDQGEAMSGGRLGRVLVVGSKTTNVGSRAVSRPPIVVNGDI